MNLKDFVDKIFNRFPPDLKRGNETKESIMLDYLKALDTGKEYNYDNAFIYLMRSYSFKTLPTAKIILETLKQYEIKSSFKEKTQEFVSLWADKGGLSYDYGVESDAGEYTLRQSLKKSGFTNIRSHDEYLRERCMIAEKRQARQC